MMKSLESQFEDWLWNVFYGKYKDDVMDFDPDLKEIILYMIFLKLDSIDKSIAYFVYEENK